MSDVTRILDRVQQGDPKAADELLPLVYNGVNGNVILLDEFSGGVAMESMARKLPGS